MGYAEKTQLITGLIILISIAISYPYFSNYYKKLNKKWLLPFLRRLMIASSLIGTHQIFEFLSLSTNNTLIYKFGLLLSITGMLFYLLSLEKLYNRTLPIKFFTSLIIIVALYLFTKPVSFTIVDFHLAHHSIFIWLLVWFILFIYWNLCIIFEQKNVQKFISKSLAVGYLLSSMTISFLMALSYSVWTYHMTNADMYTTAPSIWCTFGVVQVVFLPFFLYTLPRKMSKQPPRTKIPTKSTLLYLFITTMLSILLLIYLASTGCFNITYILN